MGLFRYQHALLRKSSLSHVRLSVHVCQLPCHSHVVSRVPKRFVCALLRSFQTQQDGYILNGLSEPLSVNLGCSYRQVPYVHMIDLRFYLTDEHNEPYM